MNNHLPGDPVGCTNTVTWPLTITASKQLSQVTVTILAIDHLTPIQHNLILPSEKNCRSKKNSEILPSEFFFTSGVSMEYAIF